MQPRDEDDVIDEEELEKEPEDFDPPFSQPDDVPKTLTADDEDFDTNQDPTGVYHSGSDIEANRIDDSKLESPIRMRAADPSTLHGPVRVVKPAKRRLPHAKIYGED